MNGRCFATWVLGLCLAIGCASEPGFVWYSALPTQPKLAGRATISPGDRIHVEVAQHPEFSDDFEVGMSGEYNHKQVGLVLVAGADATKAAEIVRVKLSRLLQDPIVSVTLLSYKPIGVTVVGEVRTPGAFQLAHGASVMAALGAAGGLSDFAAQDKIYVLRAQQSGQRIRFRYSDLTKPDPLAMNFELREGDAILVE